MPRCLMNYISVLQQKRNRCHQAINIKACPVFWPVHVYIRLIDHPGCSIGSIDVHILARLWSSGVHIQLVWLFLEGTRQNRQVFQKRWITIFRRSDSWHLSHHLVIDCNNQIIILHWHGPGRRHRFSRPSTQSTQTYLYNLN